MIKELLFILWNVTLVVLILHSYYYKYINFQALLMFKEFIQDVSGLTSTDLNYLFDKWMDEEYEEEE